MTYISKITFDIKLSLKLIYGMKDNITSNSEIPIRQHKSKGTNPNYKLNHAQIGKIPKICTNTECKMKE